MFHTSKTTTLMLMNKLFIFSCYSHKNIELKSTLNCSTRYSNLQQCAYFNIHFFCCVLFFFSLSGWFAAIVLHLLCLCAMLFGSLIVIFHACGLAECIFVVIISFYRLLANALFVCLRLKICSKCIVLLLWMLYVYARSNKVLSNGNFYVIL